MVPVFIVRALGSKEKLDPLSVMGWFSELGAMAAPGFPIGKQLFQQISIPCKTAFLLFLHKSFQTFQPSWSLPGFLPDESSCRLLIVMKNPFQTGELLQVLLRADPKSDPFRDTFQEKAAFFFFFLIPSGNSVQKTLWQCFTVKTGLGKLDPPGVFF